MQAYQISFGTPLEQGGKYYFIYTKYYQTFKFSSKTNREYLHISFKSFSVKIWILLLHHHLEQNYEKLKLSQNKPSVTSTKAKLESVHLFLNDILLASLI